MDAGSEVSDPFWFMGENNKNWEKKELFHVLKSSVFWDILPYSLLETDDTSEYVSPPSSGSKK
jgi:hypothetical protein